MTFDNSFTLSRMADDARSQFSANLTRVEKIDGLLDQHMNGKSMSQIAGSAVGSFAWLVVYILLFVLVKDMQSTPLPVIALTASLILMLLILVVQFSQLKYYGSITRTRGRLSQMRSRMESGERALSADLRTFTGCRSAGWHEALNPGESIPEELEIIERSVGAMASLQAGALQKAKHIAYYITCLAWTAAGSFALQELLESILGGDLSDDWIMAILLIGTLIAMVMEYFLAKYLWSQTGCTVTNLTLFATVAGPLLFALLVLAVGLVVAVVYLVFQLIVYALALIIGGAILTSFCSGG